MLRALKFAALSLAALVAVSAFAGRARGQTSGVNATHDPSRIVESNGKFYFCSTGGSAGALAQQVAV